MIELQSTLFSVGGRFFEAGFGKLNCSTLGAKSISTVSECKKAALALNVNYKDSEIDDNYPSGCYIYKRKEVFWNKHVIGAKDKESSPICKIGKYKWSRIEFWNFSKIIYIYDRSYDKLSRVFLQVLHITRHVWNM